MKKKSLRVFMLTLLVAQTFGTTVSAVAPNETGTEMQVSHDNGESTIPSKEDSSKDVDSSVEDEVSKQESEVPHESTDSDEEKATPNVTQSSEEPKVAPLNSKIAITDEILSNMTIADNAGTEFSTQTVNRLLNSTPVIATLNFVIEDKDYAPGSTYTMSLPDYLGYSDISGKINGVDADWSVNAASKTLTIQFNQRITDTQFKIDLRSYLYTEKMPLFTIETPGQIKNSYTFDLFENVDSINYKETKDQFGIQGDIYYNLDRTLSGNQTLELLMNENPGATFIKNDEVLTLHSYDVDVFGNILPETKQELVQDVDYTFAENTVTRTALTIPNMNQQKAYVVTINRTIGIESVSDYTYSFSQSYPTTKTGSVGLKSSTAPLRGIQFTAKTSLSQKGIKERNLNSISYGNFQSKGVFYLTIYDSPAQTKTGQQIIVESKNGQELGDIKLTATTPENVIVPITDYFDINKSGNKLVLTATKDSVLRIRTSSNFSVPFDKKDIILGLTTPVIQGDKEFVLISDKYVEPISIINPLNAETAWGNYTQNGAYLNRTTINVEGSSSNPIKNLEINVKQPDYLSLRVPPEINYYYKINQDYTITETAEGSVIKFTTPITRTINIPLGFNYVPDSLAQNKFIPIDTIPVIMSADGQSTVNSTVTTNSKQGSERTLQGSKNQFLVNARNDSYDSLIVNTKTPIGADVTFDIYDVSNNVVSDIYPQYWDRGYYFDNPMDKNSEGYPVVTFDQTSNTYTFDFGKTSKRYIIEYKHVNGWTDGNPVIVTGSAMEPLYNNRVQTSSVSVSNEALDILSGSNKNHDTLKNVVQNEIKTKNINGDSRKVINPEFDILTKGTTNAQVDINSITISDVPREAYTVEQTPNGAKIKFTNYTLTQNITIQYNTISANAGQLYTETTIQSESLDSVKDSRKKVTTTGTTLQFSEGDGEGIVYLAQAEFHTHQEGKDTTAVPDVHLQLVDNVTNTVSEFVTDSEGNYNFSAIMSGDYTLRVTGVPAGYKAKEEDLAGKTIKIAKGTNSFNISLTKIEDLTSVLSKDSTLYVGDSWNAKDNFVSATDNLGNPVEFSEITVTGEVDTSKAGIYPVSYSYGDKTEPAKITVKDDLSTLVVRNSTLYVGDKWLSKDNFVSATDKDGHEISFEQVSVSGNVDTSKAGIYPVSYSYGDKTEPAKITVKDDLSTLVARNSTLYVGDKWLSKDNFVSATDKDGHEIPFEQVSVSGNVDTSKKGEYDVTYTVNTSSSNQPNLLFAKVFKVKGPELTDVAKITVIDKNQVKPEPEPKPNPNPNAKPDEPSKVHTVKPDASKSDKTETLPQTGEHHNYVTGLVGVGLVLISLAWFRKSRLNRLK